VEEAACGAGPRHHVDVVAQAAEQAQQRGERRHGTEAIPHFEEAVRLYKACMERKPNPETLSNAQVLCAESMQMWAKAVLAAEEHQPDEEQSTWVEKAANEQAMKLYKDATEVRHYKEPLNYHP
jgi:hypothetical protein